MKLTVEVVQVRIHHQFTFGILVILNLDSFVYKYVKEINVGYPNRIICKILHRRQDILVNIESESERNSYEQYRCAEI